jgi:hypothetical protein
LTNQTDAVKLAALERTAGWRTMMGTPASRRVMWERFEVMGIYQVSPTVEPAGLAFNEGRRSLALQVMNDLLAECPDLYDRMVTENRKRLAVELAQSQLEGGEE